MSELMRKSHTDSNDIIRVQHAGKLYEFPQYVAEKYRVNNFDDDMVEPADVFLTLNRRYTKPGALLRGLRVRENLSQVELAKKINVTQSNLSQMELGKRPIGKNVGKRIEKLFDVDYRNFLE